MARKFYRYFTKSNVKNDHGIYLMCSDIDWLQGCVIFFLLKCRNMKDRMKM